MISVNRRAEGGAHPLNRGQVLDHHGQPCEDTAFIQRFLHQGLSVFSGPVKSRGRQCVDRAIHFIDARFHRINHIKR